MRNFKIEEVNYYKKKSFLSWKCVRGKCSWEKRVISWDFGKVLLSAASHLLVQSPSCFCSNIVNHQRFWFSLIPQKLQWISAENNRINLLLVCNYWTSTLFHRCKTRALCSVTHQLARTSKQKELGYFSLMFLNEQKIQSCCGGLKCWFLSQNLIFNQAPKQESLANEQQVATGYLILPMK